MRKSSSWPPTLGQRRVSSCPSHPSYAVFLEKVVQPQVADTHVEPLVASMVAVFRAIDLLQGCKTTGAVDPAIFRHVITEHLRLYKVAYGEDAIRFKHHCAIHLPEQLRRWKRLLSTMTMERRHRAVKRYGRGRTNLQSFENSVMRDLTCHSIWQLGQDFLSASTESKPSRKQLWELAELFPGHDGHQFTLHNKVSTAHGDICTAGDVVAYASGNGCRFGELLMTVGISGARIAVVSDWGHSSPPAEFLFCNTARATTVHVKADMLIEAVAYQMSADRKSCCVCLPHNLRHRMRVE